MTEILTESFCERCGTRYTFESARPRARMKGVKVLSRGLKNFVLSDDTSMDEAMAAARNETDREATAHQLDAFHKTFNFCMSCRQYTCPNCWNEVEARCLSCAPHLGHEIMPAPFPDMPTGLVMADPLGTDGAVATNGTNGINGSNGAVHEVELIGVAETDALRRDEEVDAAARLEALTAPAPIAEPVVEAVAEPVAELEPVAEVVPEAAAEPAVFAEPMAEPGIAPESEPVADVVAEPVAEAAEPTVDDVAVAARLAAIAAASPDASTDQTLEQKLASQTSGLFHRFRPGQSLDAELDAYEREQAAAVETVVDEPIGTSEPAAETDLADLAVAAIASEAVVDAVAEPVAVAEPAAEPEPEAVAEPVGVAEPVAEPDVAAEPEPVAETVAAFVAEPEPEPEPVAAAEPVVEPATAEPPAEPAVPAQPAVPAPVADDVVPQPIWHMVAPDPAVDAVPTQAPVVPAPVVPTPAAHTDQAEPQWPSRPVSTSAAHGLPFLGRPATPTGGLEALWAESTRELVATPTAPGKAAAGAVVQPCVSCGLSLSATARFCRRCGTAQG